MFQTSTCHSCNDLHGAGLARSGCAGERDARSRSFSLPVLDLHRDGRLPSPPFPLCSKKGGGWKKTKRGLLAHESWSRTIYVKAKLAHTTFTSMAAWQHGSRLARQVAKCTAMRVSFTQQAREPPPSEPKVRSEQAVPHSARLFARFARRAGSVFYSCCVQLGSC